MKKDDIRWMINVGYTIIPLHPQSKIPMVKWREYQWAKPCPTLQAQLINYDTDAWAVVTGVASQVMVLDLDTPFNEDVLDLVEDDEYVTTPSGGRHYYYVYQHGDAHGVGVRPNTDIPRIARIYAIPNLNLRRIPLQPVARTDHVQGNTIPVDPNPPHVDDIMQCTFMQWYTRERDNDMWDGRYPLARAFASNIAKVRGASPEARRLGHNYRHEGRIYESIDAPLRCTTIYQQFRCPDMGYDGQCRRAAATSPLGLAKRIQWLRNTKKAGVVHE